MKKYLLILLLIPTCTLIKAQSIDITYSYQKNGLGLMLELPAVKKVSLLYSYEHNYLLCGNSSLNMDKYGVGVRINKILILPTYNKMYNIDNRGDFNLKIINKVSCEVGCMINLGDRIQTGLMYDVFNFDARLTLGYRFKFKT